MIDINSILTDYDFKTYLAEDVRSIGYLLSTKPRCGIYVLYFDNDTYYVGQSVNVFRRFMEHSRIYSHIQKISYRKTRKDKNELDFEEIQLIKLLELTGFHLLNVVHTSISYQSSDFDVIMSLDQQRSWIDDINIIDQTGERFIDKLLQEKYHLRFQQEDVYWSEYAAQIKPVLREYIQRGIPRFKPTESSYWNCSYLPSGPINNVYARLNINWQSVMSAYLGTESAFFDFWLARSPLPPSFGILLDGLYDRFPSIELPGASHNLAPGGDDQLYVIIRNPAFALQFVTDSSIINAIRLFNLRLVKKGRSPFNKYHCYDLINNVLYTDKSTQIMPVDTNTG